MSSAVFPFFLFSAMPTTKIFPNFCCWAESVNDGGSKVSSSFSGKWGEGISFFLGGCGYTGCGQKEEEEKFSSNMVFFLAATLL